MVDLMDFCADHCLNFHAWPTEFEDKDGNVKDFRVYMRELQAECPSFVRACWAIIENKVKE